MLKMQTKRDIIQTMINKFLILIIVMTFSFFAFSANAQVRNTDISIYISPEYPKPNESVTATLDSNTVDLNKAYISWLLDGQERLAGIGKKTFSFNSGNLNSNTLVEARIETVNAQHISKILNINPLELDMLWEAYDSYVPPFYKGKALATQEGRYKIVVMQNLGTSINPNNLSYIWKKDGMGQPDSSGWGKNSYIFKKSFLDQDNEIQVLISGIVGGTNTSGKINLGTSNPKIIFYKKDLSQGTNWEKAITGDFSISSSGETFVAEPYFFSPKDINSNELTFDWFINGERVSTPNPKNILSVGTSGGQSGNAKIELQVKNKNTLFQELTKELNVNF